MRKLFKKSLACCLAAILCVTVFAGALSVNAEEAIPSCSTNAISVKPGEDTVISLTISNFLNVLGVRFRVTLPDAVESVNSVKLGDEVLQAMDDETGVGYYILKGNTITFLSLFGAEIGDFDSTEVFTMNIAVKIKEDVEVGEYSYSTPIFEVTEDGEILSDYIVNYGAFEVVEAGPEVPECEHEYDVVNAVAATASENGSVTLVCTKCGEEVVKDVVYNQYSRPSTGSLMADSETLIRFGVRYSRDLARVGTITDGFISMVTAEDSAVASKIVKYADCEDAYDGSYDAYLTTIGIRGMAYSDDVAATAFSYDSATDTWYSGTQLVYSVKSLAEQIMASPNTTELQKTMIVNLLNFGTNAQTYFKYNTANPANSGIDAYQSYATEAGNLDGSAYNLPIPTDDAETWFAYQINLMAESKITARAFFRVPKQYSGASTAIDLSDFTVVATYTSFNGKTVEKVITSDEFGDIGTVNRFYVEIPLTSPDLKSTVTIAVYKNGVIAGPEATFSAEALASLVVPTAEKTQKDLWNSLIAFSDSAKAYLLSK